MASTFSPILRIELIGTGDQSGTWGDTTNVNLGTLIEQAIAGTATIDVTSGNVTLSNLNGATDQARCMAIKVEGTPGTTRNIVAPAVSKVYVVSNGSDSSVVLKTSVSTGLTIVSGRTVLAYYNGSDFILVGQASATANTANTLVLRDASGNFSAGTITATLTGNVTGNLNGNLTAAAPTANTAAAGTNTTQIATTAFVTSAVTTALPSGIITMWSGSVLAVPAGWLLCNGANGTPDLRDRFIVGAGSTYAVGGTGGSANAIVVSHSHTTSTAGSHRHDWNAAATFTTSNDPDNNPVNRIQGDPALTGQFPASSSAGLNSQNYLNLAGDHTHTISTVGSSGTNANLPPYYALAYIMKA
jgi:hypothetical protein